MEFRLKLSKQAQKDAKNIASGNILLFPLSLYKGYNRHTFKNRPHAGINIHRGPILLMVVIHHSPLSTQEEPLTALKGLQLWLHPK